MKACEGCFYSSNGKPSERSECQVCIWNSRVPSKVFKPRYINGILIEKPTDMFISETHYKILTKGEWHPFTLTVLPPFSGSVVYTSSHSTNSSP